MPNDLIINDKDWDSMIRGMSSILSASSLTDEAQDIADKNAIMAIAETQERLLGRVKQGIFNLVQDCPQNSPRVIINQIYNLSNLVIEGDKKMLAALKAKIEAYNPNA